MLDCLVLGDSIAKGVGQVRTECIAYVQSGINSKDWNDTYIKKIKPAKTTIISLGSNDFKNLNTEIELMALRTHVNSNKVFWILPAIKQEKQEVIKKIAKHYGDTILIIPELSPDRVHPTYKAYKILGDQTK